MASKRLEELDNYISDLNDILEAISEDKELTQKQRNLLAKVKIDFENKNDLSINIKLKLIELLKEKNEISPRDLESERKLEEAKKKMKDERKKFKRMQRRDDIEQEDEKVMEEYLEDLGKKIDKSQASLIKRQTGEITYQLSLVNKKIEKTIDSIDELENAMKKQGVEEQEKSVKKIKTYKKRIEILKKERAVLDEKLKNLSERAETSSKDEKAVRFQDIKGQIQLLRNILIKEGKTNEEIEKELEPLIREKREIEEWFASKNKGGQILLRETIKEIIDNYNKGEPFSFEKIIDKLKEELPESEERDDVIQKLDEIYLIDIENMYKLFSLYLRRNTKFLDLVYDYYYQIKEYSKDDLKKVEKDELLSMVKKRKFPNFNKFTDKDSKILKKLLLEKKCSPELEIFCKEDEVCDVSTERCLDAKDLIEREPFKPPVAKKKGYMVRMYKGGLLYGKTKEMEQFMKTLKVIDLDEQKRAGEFKRREKYYQEVEEEKLEAGLTREERIAKLKEIRAKKEALKLKPILLIDSQISSLNQIIQSLVDDKELNQSQKEFLEDLKVEIDLEKIKNKLSELELKKKEIYPSEKGEIVFPLATTYDPNRVCLTDYKLRNWIKGFKNLYILMADGTKPERIYILENDQKKYDGKTWYRASDLFNFLNCNKYQIDRRQNGDILTLFKDDGEILQFKLLIESSDGLIVQDEEIFKKEQEWFLNKRVKYEERLERILSQKLEGEMFIKIRTFLVDTIYRDLMFWQSKLFPNEKLNEKELFLFALEIEKQIRDKMVENSTIKNYLREAGNFLLLLEYRPVKIGKSDQTTIENFLDDDYLFIKRLLKKYYNKENLTNLKNSDKLERFYLSEEIPQKNKVILSKILAMEVDNFIYNFLDSIIYNLDESIVKSRLVLSDTMPLYLNIGLDKMLKPITKDKSYDFIYLKEEDGVIVEYDLENLFTNLVQDPDYLEPTIESEIFKKYIFDTYDVDRIYFGSYDFILEDYDIPAGMKVPGEIKEVQDLEKVLKETQEKEKAKLIYELLFNSIYFGQEEKKEEAEEKKEEDKTWEDLYEFQEDLEKLEEKEVSEEIKPIEEEIKPEKEESEEEVEMEKPKIKTIKEKREEKKQLKEEKKENRKKKICEQCKEMIEGEGLTSLIKTSSGAKKVSFCNTTCMEKQSFRKQKD